MSAGQEHPGDPVQNLMIGTIIEVDGTHIVAELDAQIAELSRVYGGVIYPIYFDSNIDDPEFEQFKLVMKELMPKNDVN